MSRLRRAEGLGPFILDMLHAAIAAEQAAQMQVINDRLGELPLSLRKPDEDLLRPWREFQRQPGNELAKKAIMQHEIGRAHV